MKQLLLIALVSLSFTAPAAKGEKDWPMWGGSPDRNMVADVTGAPTTWDVKTGKNVKWVA